MNKIHLISIKNQNTKIKENSIFNNQRKSEIGFFNYTTDLFATEVSHPTTLT